MLNVEQLKKRLRELSGQTRAISGSIDFSQIIDEVADFVSLNQDQTHIQSLRAEIEKKKSRISQSLHLPR
jgi:hypothetical protein